MAEQNINDSKFSINKHMWPIYPLGGFQILAFSGIYIIIVPLSNIFWPNDPYHAFEMGLLITSMFWMMSIAGLIFGRLIDKYNRKKILFIVALSRGSSMILLSLTIEGLGINSWLYFYTLALIFCFFAGGNYPTVLSIAHDTVPLNMRSRFFGIYGIVRNIFQLGGFLFSGSLVQAGLWRIYFITIGIALITSGFVMYIELDEPKRGAQTDELKEALEEDSVEYKYQIDKKTMRSTMLSKTNLVALIEGIFTQLFMGSLTILFLPYVQSPPHNISPLNTSLFITIFGITAGILGRIYLARASDKWASNNHKIRLFLIIFALLGGAIFFVFLFFIPLPVLTETQGADFLYVFGYPVFWIMGLCFLISQSISGLYEINQGPIIQEINLPEAQGQIVSWNKFLENISFGAGPLVSGIFISLIGENYQIVSIFIAFFTIPGMILWVFALKSYQEDKKTVQQLLTTRADEIKSKSKFKSI
ncbi:MAG: MFS transporter [Candidatus Lokiarchaeota archaeon]|nr:MFS transporter [Candidatus Lokiarchaeota archaeon]MBD3200911.1 MFS transporter [Candidatus Lokiarchaeota archaeon]